MQPTVLEQIAKQPENEAACAAAMSPPARSVLQETSYVRPEATSTWVEPTALQLLVTTTDDDGVAADRAVEAVDEATVKATSTPEFEVAPALVCFK